MNRKDKIRELLKQIKPADKAAMDLAKKRWGTIAKPLHSLGKLEDVVVKMIGMTGAERIELDRSALVIFCADHGVVAEGVTQTGSEITRLVADNFAKRETSVTVMAERAGVEIFPVDIGMYGEHYESGDLEAYKVYNRKIAAGSGNLAVEAAMNEEQCAEALLTGIEIAGELKERGYQILSTGEMGIGNTTPSSALAAAFLNQPADVVTGRGAGLSSEGLDRKIDAVCRGVGRLKNLPEMRDAKDGFDQAFLTLAEVGGYDIAGIAGLFLGGAIHRIPVIADGFISCAAALTAVRMLPAVADYIMPSHNSKEPGAKLLLDELGMEPMLDCDMCLGEGTGAVAVLPLLRMGVDVFMKMSTFEDIKMEAYTDYDDTGDGGKR